MIFRQWSKLFIGFVGVYKWGVFTEIKVKGKFFFESLQECFVTKKAIGEQIEGRLLFES